MSLFQSTKCWECQLVLT